MATDSNVHKPPSVRGAIVRRTRLTCQPNKPCSLSASRGMEREDGKLTREVHLWSFLLCIAMRRHLPSNLLLYGNIKTQRRLVFPADKKDDKHCCAYVMRVSGKKCTKIV